MDLPEVPKDQRPKRCPHYGVDELTADFWREMGWEPVDVRLMPNLTDGDRAESVKAYLEGVRLGTIQSDAALLKFIELEARVYGLTSGKAVSTKTRKANVSDEAIDSILSFGKTQKWSKADKAEIKPGKPRGPKWRQDTQS